MRTLVTALFIVLVLAAGPIRAADGPLKKVGDFPLPGRTTRWDYQALDPSTGKLYIAHLGDSEVVVMDIRTKKVLSTIRDIAGVHGTLAVPELKRVYASATGTNEIVAIDTATDKIVARTPAGVYPDGIAYAPKPGRLFVSDENGNTETVIDVRTNRRLATIALGGKVGNSQYDDGTGHIFVNVQGLNKLVEIDPASNRVIKHIPLPGAEGNHGLLIEPRLRLAFIACEGNDRLLVLDLNTNKVVKRFAVGAGPDVLAYDQALGLLYVAGEAGVLSVFQVSANGISQRPDQTIGPNAHTIAVDGATHELYFPLKDVGGRPVMRVMSP